MGILDKMKQAKDMYGQVKKVQQAIDKILVHGESGNGHVKVTVKGNHQIHEVNISDEARNLSRDDLQKNIMNACNDAMTKVNKEIKEKMGGAMNLPSGFKLPF